MGNNLSMGQNLSSEANGIDGCAGCGLWLPPANPYFDFIKVLQATDTMTYCFWTPTEHPVIITNSVNVGLSMTPTPSVAVGVEKAVQVAIGTKLFKYFRIVGSSEYWCSKCFAINKHHIARSVFLELQGTGEIVSLDMEFVKIIDEDQ
ncbi:hypothetical protein DPMN_035753 [Dreissena polymorpha]|uniref:Uncharacterized protein n=1 Tax=Dreissena polymorpha TaxID=45954 RepID=A0A9D4RLB1_DREPO|nr:hypothetical protein DPMN_035753 [Dreissena polymorpha]